MSARALLSDPDVLAVLRNLYRVRSATLRDFAALQSLPGERLDEILAALESAGYLNRDGDRLAPVSPDAAIAASLRAAAEEQQAAIASSDALLDALPLLARDWELGSAGSEYPLSAEIIHGHEEQWQTWQRWLGQWPPQAPISLYPDTSMLRQFIAPEFAQVAQEAGLTAPFRAILPAAVCADPAEQATLELLVAGGIQLRSLSSVPYWLYVDDGLYVCIPVTWQEHPPNSILVIRQPSVVSAIAYAAEAQWALAVPYSPASAAGEGEPWEPVLRMLAQGLSDQAISNSLASSMRTVQRRITEAMDELGVTSRFELGFAYARWLARREG